MSEENSFKVPLFDGRNFGLWKRRILVALKAKKLQAALGQLVKNEEAGSTSQAQTCTDSQDNQAQMILLNSLSESVAQKVIACNTAAEIWARLLVIYENTSDVNVGQLLEEYYSYRKAPADDVSTHISKVESMAIQLEQIGQKQSEESIMAKMLHSLPESCSALKEAWESVHPDLKTRDNLTARMLKYDRSTGSDARRENGVALIAGKGTNSRSEEVKSKKKRSKCYNCGKMGHYSRDCRSPRREDRDSNKGPSVALVVGEHRGMPDKWVIDCAASRHICCRQDWFQELKPWRESILVGNNDTVSSQGIGTVILETDLGGTKGRITMDEVLFVPEMSYNLFSSGQAGKRGAITTTGGPIAEIRVKNVVVAYGDLNPCNNITVMRAKAIGGMALLVSTKRTLAEWHETLGHADPRVISEMAKSGAVDGMEIIERSDIPCEVCPIGKGTRAPHTMEPSFRPKEVGELVHLDLVGPIEPATLGKKRYIMLATDAFSGFRHVYLLEKKDETADRLATYFADFEASSGKKIRVVYADCGTEFVNKKIQTLFGLEHVQLITSAPYTPQQNGAAERSNRTIIETSRTLLAQRGLPDGLWGEAVATATYVRNRIPKRGSNSTPFELFTGRKPFVGHIVAFGTPIQALITERRLAKFDPKTESGFVVGYTNRSNTYRVFVPERNVVKETSDVIFRGHGQEKSGPSVLPISVFEINVTNSLDNQGDGLPPPRVIDQYFRELDERGGHLDTTDDNTVGGNDSELVDGEEEESPSFSTITQVGSRRESQETGKQVDQPQEQLEEPPQDAGQQVEISGREEQPSGRYVNDESIENPFRGRSLPREQSDIRYPNVFLSCTIPERNDDVPSNYLEAITSPEREQWFLAVKNEILAHNKNKTWVIAKRPINGSLLSTKWVFAKKRDSSGKVEKFKARLVARGFEQKFDGCAPDTYAPVAKQESIRVLCALAAAQGKHIERFDVTGAFLYGPLEEREQVMIEVPEGVSGVGPGNCLRLQKALYGLCQAPRVWNSTFDNAVRVFGFTPLAADSCVYVCKQRGIYLALYVDDGMIVAKSEQSCLDVIDHLQKYFDVKRIRGDLFLGMRIKKVPGGIHLGQSRYIADIIQKFRLETAGFGESTPLVDTKILFNNESGRVNAPYRAAIGSLLYLALATRPDILFPTILLSKFNEDPRQVHWAAVKRIMKYLAGTVDLGLLMRGPSKRITIDVYCDADWAGDENTRKSTTGIIILLCGSPVVFVSRQQGLVSLSSTEAEYIAACDAVRELNWLISLLTGLGISLEKPRLFIDNQSAISLIKNNEVKRRSKHIDTKFHFIRDWFKKERFEIHHVSSQDQRADFLTKRVPQPSFKIQIDRVGIVESNRETAAHQGAGSGDREGVLGKAIPTAAAVRKFLRG